MKKGLKIYKSYWELATMLFFMTIVCGVCHQTSVWEQLRFFGFQLFCLFIPGIAVMLLLPMKNLRSIERVLYAYAMGYILTTILYLLIILTLGDRFTKVIFIIMAVLAFAFVCNHIIRFEHDDFEESSDGKMWICTVLVVFFVSLVVFSLRLRIPYIGQNNSYNSDYLDWVRKIAVFKEGRSVFGPMLKNYPYHYLGMIQQAAVAKATDISAFGMASQYSHIESSVFFGLSSYAIVTRLIKNKKAQIITLILMLFSTGFESKALTTYLWHIYLVPMSYHIAQSLGVMVILLVLIQLDEEFDFHKLLVTVSLLVCCTGTKGATGAIIFGGVTVACMYSFWIQKRKKVALAYFISTFLGFGMVYLYLTPTASMFSDTADAYLASEERVISIAGYIERFLSINPWTMLPMVVLIFYSIAHRNIKKEYLILFAMTIAGTIFGYFIVFYGHSEMYFTLTAFPFAALLAGCLWDIIFCRVMPPRGQTIVMLLLCSVIVCSALFRMRDRIIKGLDNFWIFHDNIVENTYGELVVDYHEWYAYEWIRTHTDPDTLVLANRLRIVEEEYLLQGFMERQLMGFEGNLTEAEDFEHYADLGVEYIVVNKVLSVLECPQNKGEIVFENNEMVIYELY